MAEWVILDVESHTIGFGSTHHIDEEALQDEGDSYVVEERLMVFRLVELRLYLEGLHRRQLSLVEGWTDVRATYYNTICRYVDT